MLLEQCRPLSDREAECGRFLSQPIFGPLGALTAPGALERRLWGQTGDKSGLWLPRARAQLFIEA